MCVCVFKIYWLWVCIDIYIYIHIDTYTCKRFKRGNYFKVIHSTSTLYYTPLTLFVLCVQIAS